MRLWSLHPKYLDRKGLTAVWREGLLAQKVLAGETRGYRNHPQLTRFRECRRPVSAIGLYLRAVYDEAARRGYAFDARKINSSRCVMRLPVKRGQIKFEWRHLLAKLRRRDRKKYLEIRAVSHPKPHPLFRITAGGVEDWERNPGAAGAPGNREGA
jgi:hypothetical protein